jgi:leader peptidase (prepilin peptidase) / N-methyltransferase
MIILLFSVITFSLIWGSFLNVVAYRSVTDKPFLQKRSTCNECNSLIFWYDNIPVISWIILKGRCRNCKNKISILYPFIEILTTILITFLFYNIFQYGFSYQNIFSFIAYFIFFSALIISVRTDLQDLVIPQVFSIWLVPLGFIFSYLGFLRISFYESFFGAIFGYFFLWFIAFLFKFFAKKEGLGKGDMELLALVGSFLGPVAVWFTVLISSFSGLFIGGIYILIKKKDQGVRIPFGPFIVIGAVIAFFFNNLIYSFLNI